MGLTNSKIGAQRETSKKGRPSTLLLQQQLVATGETLTLIPGLPNEVASQILAFVPYSHHSRLKPTCKSWFLFFSSETLLFDRRSKFNSLSNLLCIFPSDPSISPPFLFDASNRAWRPLPPLPSDPSSSRYCFSNFTSISLGPHIYLLGGRNLYFRSSPMYSVSDLRFNFVKFSWEPIAPMIYPRSGFACVVVRSLNQIIVAGGQPTHDAWSTLINSVESYDVARNKWVLMAGLPKCRAGCVGFVVEESCKLWVMGGYGFGSKGYPELVYCRDAVVKQLKNNDDDDGGGGGDWGTWRDVGKMWNRDDIGKIVVLEDENQGRSEVFMLDMYGILR